MNLSQFSTLDWIAVGGASVVFVYALYKRFFYVAPTPPPAPPKPFVEMRDYTLQELASYNGTDPSKPILLAVKGNIYDVTPKSGFYGPGGPYCNFAGRDASRALAKSDTSVEMASNPRIDDLSQDELSTLNDWEDNYRAKYTLVGRII
eukprot:TRINITY_DN1286_c0_g1_i1.p1 TRINITY_DN1286_c0_g1~~TRINITY_DN1286_c0_g1_i1.p1  ORF type:complete len:148 (-),score=46.17 TRINITY_DN1286_c0_g1_i1:205-648(-)